MKSAVLIIAQNITRVKSCGFSKAIKKFRNWLILGSQLYRARSIYVAKSSSKDSLHIYVPFDDNYLDISGNELPVWCHLSKTYVEGVVGKAITINNDSIRVNDINTPPLNFYEGITISFWAKHPTNSYSSPLNNLYFESTSGQYIAVQLTEINTLGGGTQVAFRFRPQSGPVTKITFPLNVRDDKWRFYCIRVNGLTGKFETWVDDVKQEANIVCPYPDPATRTIMELSIPANGTPNTSKYYLDELAIFKRALTDKEINQLYKGV